MIQEIVRTLVEMNLTHGITHFAMLVGGDLELQAMQLEGFIKVADLEGIPEIVCESARKPEVIGRVPAFWIVKWDLIAGGYVYTKEVFNGRIVV